MSASAAALEAVTPVLRTGVGQRLFLWDLQRVQWILFCFMSPRIYKLDGIQAAALIFLLFIQDVMFWRSNRKQEQSVQLLHSISITLLLLWLHWAFRPEGFTDAPLPACLLADSQRACMLASLFPEGLPFLLSLISSWSCYFILSIHPVSWKPHYA